MANILLIDLGTIPNDGTGDPLRVGGQDINANFNELNIKKLENGGFGGNAQDIVDSISAIQANYVTTNTPQTITALKTFSTLPQSTAVPGVDSDLVNKLYVDQNVVTPTGLEAINEGNGIGWRLIGKPTTKTGIIGLGSVDFQDNANALFTGTNYGALAPFSGVFGEANTILPDGSNFGTNFAMGSQNTINSIYASFAQGWENNIVNGYIGGLFGYLNTMNSNTSLGINYGFGLRNQLTQYWSFAMGVGLVSRTEGSFAVGLGNEDITEGTTQADRRIFTVGIGTPSKLAGANYGVPTIRKDGFRVRYNGVIEAPNFLISDVPSNPKNLATVEWVQTLAGVSTLQQVLDAGDDATSPDGFSQVFLDLQDGGSGSTVLRTADKDFSDPTVNGSELGITIGGINLSTIKGGYRAGSGSDGSGGVAVSLLSVLNLNNNGTTNLINGLPIADAFNFNLLIPRPDLTANKDSFLPVVINTKEADNKGVLTVKEENIDGSMINFGNVASAQVLDLSQYTVFVATVVSCGCNIYNCKPAGC